MSKQFRSKLRQLQNSRRRLRVWKRNIEILNDDVRPIVESLAVGELPGDRITDLNLEIYKVRVKNSNNHKGKSGGYRLIYYVKTLDRVILVTIYTKSEQSDIEKNEIDDIIAEFE
jgi:mRNA-degrading endonuclease RelE of RelBE toxin-antitoxin system